MVTGALHGAAAAPGPREVRHAAAGMGLIVWSAEDAAIRLSPSPSRLTARAGVPGWPFPLRQAQTAILCHQHSPPETVIVGPI
jgi:hypothetical protein